MTLGQFGSSSDTARNEAIYRTAAVGGSFDATDRITLGIDASYTTATESLDAIDLSAPPEVLEKLHWGSYDFSDLHTYSNLDTDMLDVTLRAEARLTAKLSGTLEASYIDATDNTPYLEDLTGSFTYYTLGLRWLL